MPMLQTLNEPQRLIETPDQSGLVSLFDREARELIGLSGREVYQKIQAGNAGDNFGWADLLLLYHLLPASPRWPS